MQNDLAEAVDAIRKGVHKESSVDLLNRIISRGDGPELVSELIAIERISHMTDEEAVSHAMRHLEALEQASSDTACMLMTSLWPIAGDLFMHHIWDAIDLYVWHCDSERLTSHLKRIAKTEEDAGQRRHLESLIQERGKGSGPEQV
jgi:hypothetical protein